MQSQAATYKKGVEEVNHLKSISLLADWMSSDHGKVLAGGRLRIGIAQKALNLFLKTLWCLDSNFANPPHCPVDGIILKEAGIWGSWTQLDSIDIYSEWISVIRRRAKSVGYDSICEWELATWNH